MLMVLRGSGVVLGMMIFELVWKEKMKTREKKKKKSWN